MGYGEIIKRAWTITWRYRVLWVLGLFAGVSGAGGGGGGGGNYGNFNPSGGSRSGSGDLPNLDGEAMMRTFQQLLPVIIVGAVALFVLSIVWWILSVAARGGLVFAVNEIEEGRPVVLGAAWSAGFSRFWSVFGLSLILTLPILVLLMIIMLMIFIPLFGPLVRGAEPSGWVVAPICGSLAIGIPLLIVLGLILGLMRELGLRYIMLGGQGAVQAIGQSWRAFRGRFKDTVLMWLISWGLNIAAGIVIAIPVVIITLVVVVPAVMSAVAGQWGAFAVVLAIAFVVLTVVSLVYTAIWGTYTSSLWTVFYRRFTGMEAPAAALPVYPPPPAPGVETAPLPPSVPMPPTVPEPPAPTTAPPAPDDGWMAPAVVTPPALPPEWPPPAVLDTPPAVPEPPSPPMAPAPDAGWTAPPAPEPPSPPENTP